MDALIVAATGSPAVSSKHGSPTPEKPRLRVVERGSQACNECRRHKIRCHPAPDDPEHIKPCARCVRMSLECVFKKHNRGRKRKNPPPDDGGVATPIAQKQPHLDGPRSGATPSSQSYWGRGSPDRSLFPGVSKYPFVAGDSAQDADGPRGPPPMAQISLQNMVRGRPWDEEHDGDYYSGTDEEYVRERVTERPLHSVISGAAGGDAITLGYVTLEEARELFQLFLKHFNPAMAIIDPVQCNHDFVRQNCPFTYHVILTIASRYMNLLPGSTAAAVPPSANSVHQQILVLARDQLMWAFAEAISNVDVVQAVMALCLWKEPDDDKAAFYFSRVVVLAKELDLGSEPPMHQVARMTDSERRELRHRQRLWLSLFSTSSIFHMQFRQPMLITQLDPLVSTCQFWLKHTAPEYALMDTFSAFSADLRRRYLSYKELLNDPYPSPLTLSVLTKTINTEWEHTSEAWIREIIDAGGSPSYVHKPRVWYAALALNLNLQILNKTLRIPPHERIAPPPPTAAGAPTSISQLRCIPAFHASLNNASTVLMRVHDLDKSQITFASDTFLHFSLYAATFLWSLCRRPQLYDFEDVEVEYIRDLILKVATAFEAASPYPGSSPALHAKYLRRLCRPRRQYESSEGTSDDLPPPVNREELEFVGDFGWVGVDLPWSSIDPALQGVTAEQPHQPHQPHPEDLAERDRERAERELRERERAILEEEPYVNGRGA